MAANRGNRTRVKTLVSVLPGLHLRRLQRITGLSFNSTRYHVEALEKAGEIVRAEEGGFSRLYPNGTSESDKVIYSLAHNASDKKIITRLLDCPGSSCRELCDATGLAKSTISEHLAQLSDAGVVKAYQTTHQATVYELDNPDRIRKLLGSGDTRLLEKAAKEFLDLWDF